jgi:aryl-alcohol dehydrogenase-like predicted oxidoreductase
MYEYCREENLDLMALNYHFIKENPAISTIIVGPSSKVELKENLNAFHSEIDKEKFDNFLKHFKLAAAKKQTSVF